MEARTYGVHSYNIFSAEVSGLSVLFASKTVDPETYFMDPESKEIRKLSKEQYLVFNSDVLTFATTEFPVQFEFNSEREIEGFNFFVCNDLTADRKLVRFQRNDAESNNPKSLAPYKFLMTSQRNNNPKPAAAAGAPGVPGALPLANAGATQNAMGAVSLAGLVALLHHTVSGDGFSALYVVWTIRIVVDDAIHSLILIYKRYRDIYRFREQLVKEFPTDHIPVLPPKDIFSLGRIHGLQLWLESRRKGLQWFMANVLLNPKYQHHQAITDFVLS
ncbi:hypothetical protein METBISCDRAFT_26636 [Metschnikowia bicuspidata]|uniref:Endosomal/vacuolar adapter protein YPT35 n=1 Tax=Metschnikowia bicuspidata TaxID=27322 RepID=A0A4P9ZEJ3_9ASCO|nr:hypothetical protein METBISCDRAFT_26636 [Metschnikowia bicuspidata]